MPGVNSVAPRVQGGLLDTVLKGVQVARDVYGIKHEMAATDAAEQDAANKQTSFNDEQAGNFTPKETVALGKDYNFVTEGTPNAQRIGRKGPDGVEDAFILPKKQGLPQSQTVFDALVDGKHGTATYAFDPETGAPKLINFVETAKPDKPAKEPTPHYTTLADSTGKLWKTNTLTGDVTPVEGTDDSKFGKGGGGGTDKKTTTRFDNLTNYLTGGRSAPQDIKQESTKLRTAAHGLSLLNGGNLDELNKMTPIEMQELAGVLAGQVAQGSPAQATLQHMTPDTAAKSLSEAFQYLTGKPADANQGEFAQLFGKMLDRQVQTSQNILADKFNAGIANALDLRDEDPAKFDRIMKASGITLDKDGNVLAYNPSFLGKAKGGKQPATENKGGASMAIGATTAPAGVTAIDTAAELAKRGVKVQAPAAAPASDTPDRAQQRTSSGGM